MKRFLICCWIELFIYCIFDIYNNGISFINTILFLISVICIFIEIGKDINNAGK